jgi:CheY-like chemotaxis protein
VSAPELEQLISALSSVRHIGEAALAAGTAARQLVGADGIAFVIRDRDECYYAAESAIAPLWKGSRFPMRSCISGWVMLNDTAATIPDVYRDDRIPHEAYRPTFVKSLVVVPVRAGSPIAAIGAYWADEHLATDKEVGALQAIADTCGSVARATFAASAPATATSALPRTVLVVDDDPDNAESLKLLLSFMGHRVTTAATGAEALAVGDQVKPEIVLMDIGMPTLDGYATAAQMRSRSWGRAARLVALSGWTQDSHKKRAAVAGFDEYLVKPAAPAELKRVVDSARSVGND